MKCKLWVVGAFFALLSFAASAKVEVDISPALDKALSRTRTIDQRSDVKNYIRAPLDVLDQLVELPKFKVMVKPCGMANAFSSPNITICTELIEELVRKNADAAIPVVVLHEVGHTLLNLWGMPGWDNEDTVDEFAAVILRGEPQTVRAMAKWLRSQDSLSAAAIQLSRDDRHSLPVQRARNLERILQEERDVAESGAKGIPPRALRWFVLLAGHWKSEPDTDITVANGECEMLTLANSDLTDACDSQIIRTLYRESGKNLFVVKSRKSIPLSIKTASEQKAPNGRVVFNVEKVGRYDRFGQGENPMKYVEARGQCIIIPHKNASTFQCDVRDNENFAWQTRFIFRQFRPQ